MVERLVHFTWSTTDPAHVFFPRVRRPCSFPCRRHLSMSRPSRPSFVPFEPFLSLRRSAARAAPKPMGRWTKPKARLVGLSLSPPEKGWEKGSPTRMSWMDSRGKGRDKRGGSCSPVLDGNEPTKVSKGNAPCHWHRSRMTNQGRDEQAWMKNNEQR